MDLSRLKELGLAFRKTDKGAVADLEISGSQLLNPLTRSFIKKVTFSVAGDKLVVADPPELVGLAPIALAGISRAADLEEQIQTALNEHILQMQRLSAQLQQLGVQPKVDPARLTLSAEVAAEGGWSFAIASDKRGRFRVAEAKRGGKELPTSTGHAFELSEFRERSALAGYLVALFDPEAAPQAAPKAPSAAHVRYSEVVERFGRGILVPPTSGLELVAVISVEGASYRFAAARVSGRTFRGLLAGPKGKLWAERFELDDFPGVATLVATLLNVPREKVEIHGEE